MTDIELILFIVVCWGADYAKAQELMEDERTIAFIRTHWRVIHPLAHDGMYTLRERHIALMQQGA